MKKTVLGLLQGLAKAFFVITSVAITLLLGIIWFNFFKEGGRIPVGSESLTIVVSGYSLPGETVRDLLNAANQSAFTAAFLLSVFTLFLGATLFPFYLIMQFSLTLHPGQWYVEGNIQRLRYLAIYFLVLAIVDALSYPVAILLFDNPFGKISFDLSELSYFFIGLGILLLSYMYQQGVKLRQEADLTV